MNYERVFEWMIIFVEKKVRKNGQQRTCNLSCDIATTSWIAILHVLPPTKNRLFFNRFEREWWNARHRFSKSFSSNVAKQVARFCCPFYRSLQVTIFPYVRSKCYNVDFNTYFSLRVILWLRGGVGGLLSRNLNLSMMNSSQKRVSMVTGSHTVEMYRSPNQVISVNTGLPSVLIGTTEHQKPFLN